MAEWPDVTAVMVTGKSPEREPFVKMAIDDFQKQDYLGPLRLWIIRDERPTGSRPYELTTDQQFCQRAVHTAVVPTPQTLGGLRNLGLDIVKEHEPGSWIIQWDDDDHHAPNRVSLQVQAALNAGYLGQVDWAVTLLRQVRYHIPRDIATVYCGDWDHGIFGTVLHGPTDARYEEVGRHEDSRFLKVLKARNKLLTVLAEEPSVYIRYYHGHNTWDDRHMFGSSRHKTRNWRMPLHSRERLQAQVDRLLGLKLQTVENALTHGRVYGTY